MKKHNNAAVFFVFIFLFSSMAPAQVLTLKDAIAKGLANYGAVKAKANYASASKAAAQQSRRDYLPNLVLSAQQDYGTVNGQNGPLYGFGGFGVASSGLPLATQNWNAGFGALYLANINWDFFAFGRARERVKVAESVQKRDENDLAQIRFQQQVQVAATYLNLLAAQRISRSQQNNLERAIIFKNNTVARAKSGLIAGVDSSLAAAEISNARIALLRAKDAEQEQSSKLAVLLGVAPAEFVLDTAFINNIPKNISEPAAVKQDAHPVLAWYKSRIDVSNEQSKLYSKSYFPVFTLFGVIQERGSGFEASYTTNQHNFTSDYGTGVKPVRGNYLLGIGLNWNLTGIARTSSQVKSQNFISAGLKDEYTLAEQQLQAQLALSDNRIKNALASYAEAPVQVKAANEAYVQKSVLYKNGLSTVVDVQQALYALNRAETDRDIAYTNVWQALLLKAASAGEITLFTNEF